MAFFACPISRLLNFALLVTSLAWLTSATPAPPASLQRRQFDDTTWQKYVRAPATTTLSPVAWLEDYSSGNITNPGGIIANGVTTLTRETSSDEMPSLVLDFGQNYAGILSIDFAGASKVPNDTADANALPGLALAFSESLEYLTNRSDFTRSDNGDTITNGTDQVAVQLSPYTWTNKHGCTFDGNKVCSDGFHGFRYLRITLQALPSDAPYTTGLGSVSISAVRLAYSAYHGTPSTFRGWFECSDSTLTQWWYDAVYTNDLCTDVFRANDTEPRDAANPGLEGLLVLFDGAKRDRDPYVGDLAVAALTLYLSHGPEQAVAAKNVLADLARHQRADGWIPPASINNYTLALFDYPLWWVVCSSDLVLYTGDTAYLDDFYANLVLVLDTYYPNATNADGLLQKGLGTTAGYGDYAFLPRSGVITYYNALYILTLHRAAQLAEIKGEWDDASRWRDRAVAIGPSLIRENWDSKVGALFDGGPCPNNNTTDKCAVHAQDGNSLAILSGATNNSEAASLAGSSSTPEASILSFMTSALSRPYGNAFYDVSTLSPSDQFDQRVYAFISYFELAARFQVAQDENATLVAVSAYDELRRLYGYMANHDPFSTFWEGIGPNGSYYEAGYTSLAHGWSTGIVPLMQNYVLGVTPTGVGFRSFVVRPVVFGGGFHWARGVVPTPDSGEIGVAWTVDDVDTGAGLQLTVAAPVGGDGGTVYVPVAEGDGTVTQDGLVVWTRSDGGVGAVRFEKGHVVVGVEAGSTNVFEVSA